MKHICRFVVVLQFHFPVINDDGYCLAGAARDPRTSHKLTFDGPMSPAAASESVTSTKWRH